MMLDPMGRIAPANRAYEGIDRMTGGLLLGYTDGENNR